MDPVIVDQGVAVQRAHRDADAFVGGRLARREEREAILAGALAPGATRPVGAGHRRVREEADPYRLCFERDLDRVKHSRPWRRLAGKCQVFIAPEDDHLRTRLTHAVEVAQVAVGIGRVANLCLPLVESIALAHDCGHGPAGHASEQAFSPYLPGTGYDHAVYGADVTLASLNLCLETLDGDHRPDQVGTFVHAVLDAIDRTGEVGMTEPAASALTTFRDFNFERIYLRPAARAQAEKVVHLLRGLVEHFADAPRRLPDVADGTHPPVEPGSAAGAALAVQYVSGMTDRFALGLGVELLGWRPEALPRGV